MMVILAFSIPLKFSIRTDIQCSTLDDRYQQWPLPPSLERRRRCEGAWCDDAGQPTDRIVSLALLTPMRSGTRHYSDFHTQSDGCDGWILLGHCDYASAMNVLRIHVEHVQRTL